MRYGLVALVRLADELDRCGMMREADEVDRILKEAVDWTRAREWLGRQYQRLRRLFTRKRKDPGAAQEYDAAAANRLDDMLRRKQSGPSEERVFLWFCNQFPNSCATCRGRHGRMRTLRQWRAEGMPGPSVCERDRCGCRLMPLVPGGAVQMDEDGDIAAGAIGVREDGIGPNMNQGFVLEPFFSDYGNLD